MHFLKQPVPLWFLPFGTGTDHQFHVSANYGISCSTVVSIDFIGAQVDFSLSVSYPITASVFPVSSVDIELTAFSYDISVSNSVNVLASLDYTGEMGGPVDAGLSITPVFVLDIAGQVNQSVAVTYPLSISASTLLLADTSIGVTYPISVSASAVLVTEGLVANSLSAVYNVTASLNVLLLKTQGTVEVNVAVIYGLTTSITPILVTPSPGGLVWSKAHGRYIPIRVGNAG